MTDWTALIIGNYSLIINAVVTVVVGAAVTLLVTRFQENVRLKLHKEFEEFKSKLEQRRSSSQKVWDWKVMHYHEMLVDIDSAYRAFDEWLKEEYSMAETGSYELTREEREQHRKKVYERLERSGWEDRIAAITRYRLLTPPDLVQAVEETYETFRRLKQDTGAENYYEHLEALYDRLRLADAQRQKLEELLRADLQLE